MKAMITCFLRRDAPLLSGEGIAIKIKQSTHSRQTKTDNGILAKFNPLLSKIIC